MRISEVIKELERIKKKEGDIKTTCTGCDQADVPQPVIQQGPYETTVENFVVHEHPRIGKCVRLWL
jgi:hypothetical protein